MTILSKGMATSIAAVVSTINAQNADASIAYDKMYYVDGVTSNLLVKPDADAAAKDKALYASVCSAVANGLASVHGADFLVLLNAEKGAGKPMQSSKAGYAKMITRSDAQRMVSGTVGNLRRNLAVRELEHKTATSLLDKDDLALYLQGKRDPSSIAKRVERIAYTEVCDEIAAAVAAARKADRDAKEAERLAKSLENSKDALKSIAGDIRADATGKYKMNPKLRATALEYLDWLTKNLS